MAAKQFAAWGASTMLDLRRIDSGELRERLGEQLGAKVFAAHGRPSDVDKILRKNLAMVDLLERAYDFGRYLHKGLRCWNMLGVGGST